MKKFPFTSSIAIVLVCSTNIFGDIVHLKDGTTIEGKVLEMNDDYLYVFSHEKNRRIHSNIVVRVEMGYTGIPVCVWKEGKEVCNKNLHSLGKDISIFLSGKGLMETETVKSGEFTRIAWTRKSTKDRISPYLRPGLILKIYTKKSVFLGEFQGANKNEVQFKTIEPNEGYPSWIQISEEGKFSLIESDILKFEWNKDSSQLDLLSSRIFLLPLPGIVQILNGDTIKGGILATGTILAFGGSIAEFQSSILMAKPRNQFIPVGDRVLIYQNAKGGNSYKAHLQNSRVLGGIAILGFIYHAWDLYNNDTWKQPLNPDKISWSMDNIQSSWQIPRSEFTIPFQSNLWEIQFLSIDF